MKKNNPIYSKIVGSTFCENGQELISQLKKGDKILWEREPKNKFDSNAIMVFNEKKQRIGYIPKDLAKEIVLDMAAGKYEFFTINVNDVTGGGEGRSYGCNVVITAL